MFALVDCNNFYVSCERVFRPDLRGRPVAVLSNNDGCVIARSNELKALGVPMGAPAFQHEALFARHGTAVFSANFALYGDMSSRVMSVLREFGADMEVYSIDEAFLDLSGWSDWKALGLEMRRRVGRHTGIPISVGIAPTKTLAKAANRIAKHFPDPTQHVHVMADEALRVKALRWLPVEAVWGIGRRHARRLGACGVRTAWDFTQLPDAWVRKQLSVTGLRLKRELEGLPVADLEAPQLRKQVAVTRSFERDCTHWNDLRERVATFAVCCAEKLRAQRTHCAAMLVFVHTNPHKPGHAQYSRHTVAALPFPTHSAMELARFAVEGLARIFQPGYAYKKAGVMALDLCPADAVQTSLLGQSDPRHKALMEAMDRINAAHGRHRVRLAVQAPGRVWRMKQERLSPCYTTRLSDVIAVYAR